MPSEHQAQTSDYEAIVFEVVSQIGMQTGILLCAYWVLSEHLLNIFGPMALLAICLRGVYRLIKRDVYLIWSPIAWFLLAYGVYFGLGPLIYSYGTPNSIALIDGYYAVSEHALFRTGLLNVIALLAVCVAVVLWRLNLRPARVKARPFDKLLALRMLFFCLFLGYGARVLIFYFQWREVSENVSVTPGVLLYVSDMARIGLAISILLYLRGERWCGKLALVLGTFEFLTAFTSLAKSNVLEAGMMVFLGVFMAWPSKKLVLWAAAMGIVAYLLLVPVVDAGRKEYWVEGERGGADSTMGLINAYMKRSETAAADDNQAWWRRLSYSNAQAFAMDAYDGGQAGDTFSLALYTPIPRALWPDKPIITVGTKFNELVTGSTGSNSGAGYFGEAYWNGGWLLVVLTGLFVGTLYMAFTRWNIRSVLYNDVRWLPAAYLSLRMGYSPDTWFAATMVGNLSLIAAILVLTFLVVRPSTAQEVTA